MSREVLLENGKRMDLDAWLRMQEGQKELEELVEKEVSKVDITKLKLKELQEIASNQGLNVDGLKKDQIIALLLEEDEL